VLHTLFPRSSREYASSRFGRELGDFYMWLQKAGYSKDNIRGHLRRLFQVLSRSSKIEADAARSRAFLQRAFCRCCTTVERSQHFRGTERAYCRFLLSQNRLLQEQSRDAVSLLLVRYMQYLVDVRGFSERTAAALGKTSPVVLVRSSPCLLQDSARPLDRDDACGADVQEGLWRSVNVSPAAL
jgi:hypothetical protein